MILLNILVFIFSGAFITNFLPHFLHGISGKTFTTPFAKPRGIGPSSPTLNVIWGVFNLMMGILLAQLGQVKSDDSLHCISFFTGFTAMALFLSKRLAKQHVYEKKEQV